MSQPTFPNSPVAEIDAFGVELVKQRIAAAKNSYEDVLRAISVDVLPAITIMATSAIMLYEKNPLLALGTIAGTGFMMAVDKFVRAKGKFWKKQQQVDEETKKQP